jgi:hypothetical protein
VDPTVDPSPPRAVAGLRVAIRLLALPLLIFGLLLALWPVARGGYLPCFRAATNATFAIAGWGEVRLEPSDPGEQGGRTDTRLAFHPPDRDDPRPLFHTSFRAQYFGYVPSAIFLALVIGASTGRRRRLRTLFWGGLLLHLFLCLRLAILIGCVHLAFLQNHPDGPPSSASWSWWKAGVERLDGLINQDPTLFAFLPIFVWVLLTVGLEDWREQRGGKGEPSS